MNLTLGRTAQIGAFLCGSGEGVTQAAERLIGSIENFSRTGGDHQRKSLGNQTFLMPLGMLGQGFIFLQLMGG